MDALLGDGIPLLLQGANQDNVGGVVEGQDIWQLLSAPAGPTSVLLGLDQGTEFAGYNKTRTWCCYKNGVVRHAVCARTGMVMLARLQEIFGPRNIIYSVQMICPTDPL